MIGQDDKQPPDPDLYAPRPKVAGLNRPIVAGVVALVVAAGIGAVVWDAGRGPEATPVTAMLVGTGRAALSGQYEPEDEQQAAERKQEQKREQTQDKPKPKLRSRRVLWGKDGTGDGGDQFADPNVKLAEAEIASWAGEEPQDAGGVHAELPGCVVKDGTLIEGMQRGGSLQIVRPVIGHDYQKGQECVAIRAGATLGLQEREDGGFCATRLDEVGGGVRQLECWEVVGIEGSNPRSAVYNVRVGSDISLGG
jgi:hypothetical protein